MDPLWAAQILAVVGAFGAALALLWWVTDGKWSHRARARLIYGVPWGSLLIVGVVLSVYLVLQRGFWTWSEPVVLPYRAWSFLYPTGLLTAGFAHASPSHLLNNLTATIVLAPLAEYLWGHYPAGDHGRGISQSAPWYQLPVVRALVIFPGVAIGVGILTALFAIGPVIGFSGVVFAFGAFALVGAPVLTLIGLYLISVLRLLYRALETPITVATISGAPPAPPGWAGIAVQGHALGFLIGFIAGVLLLWARDRSPPAGQLFVALVIYGLTRGLWAVYRVAGDGTYILYRATGVVVVILIAILLTAIAITADRPFAIPWRPSTDPVSRRQGSLLVALLLLAVIAGPAVAFNLVTYADTTAPGEQTVTVGEYTVGYGEDVPNQIVPAIDIPGAGNLTDIRTSGVIVVNDKRQLWSRHVSATRLAATGTERIRLGGPGWAATVTATRTGWAVVGNDTVYAIDLEHANESVRTFRSVGARATPVIDNRTVTISIAETGDFQAEIYHNGTYIGATSLPAVNESVVVGELTITVEPVDDTRAIFVTRDGTRVQVARRV